MPDQRSVYRSVHAAALARPDAPLPPLPGQIAGEGVMTASLYRHNGLVFLYAETLETRADPGSLVPGLTGFLAPWPTPEGSAAWVPLVDVFHFNAPVDAGHWARKTPPQKRLGRVAFLRPEKAASYIYYHYQLQEERAFGGGKYESIWMLGTLLFQYKELPLDTEAPVVPGTLATKGTPEDWSQARMDLHFQPWPDGSLYFKDAGCLIPG